ncbi:membrane protein insertion efficiency factor YidD [Candidatus Peregrinibacteria bacterium CG_4_9_14_0_2_um_filter_53_11]|nr:MAG: membrane protein insertion efficiency factor YidD [Candidatus Peregrinibacteria bacterium CG_4_9_14_0_2_um_filter_53_11]
MRAFRAPFIFLIVIYQKTLSPDHGFMKALFPGGYCKFTPTCSEYTKMAIQKKGVFIGIPKGFWRILRCNPLNKGGIDLP